MPDLPEFERTVCACAGCRVGCKTMPGMLAPGDLPQIAAAVGVPCDDDFVRQNFVAGEGSRIGYYRNGRLHEVVVPSIVPRQRDDGSCVFLTDDGLCGVHQVSPYGCRMVDVHMTRDEGDRRIVLMFRNILADGLTAGPYDRAVRLLKSEGRTAWPKDERRAAFELHLRLAEEAGKVYRHDEVGSLDA